MSYQDTRWYKTVNGEYGLAAIALSAIIFVALVSIYILRIRKEPLKIFSIVTEDYRSRRTRFLKVIVFLILAAGFVGITYYNIHKMAKGDPSVSVSVEDNKQSPPILFCVLNPDGIEVVSATYSDSEGEVPPVDVTGSISDFTLGKGDAGFNCKLFNDTQFNKPKEITTGVTYNFEFFSNFTGILVFMGEFDNIDRSRTYPQSDDIHSNVAAQMVVGTSALFTYTETRYVDLDGGKTHRGFQLSAIANVPVVEPGNTSITLFAPTSVIVNTEQASLDLAAFYSNLGGYLTICGLFGFLFGSGKVSPFGFVTDYIFTNRDRESLMQNMGTDNNHGIYSEKINAEAESKSLLTEYYVDMELFAK